MEDAPTMAIITNKDIVAKAITMVMVGNTTIIGMITIETRVECKTMRNVLCTPIWNQDIRGLSVVKISMVQTFAQRAIVKAMDAEPMNTEAANATTKMVPTTLSIVKRTTIWRLRAPTMCTTSISLAQ
eukprot:scaffold15448_cov469-Alexandrium_tamarense.AAC.1